MSRMTEEEADALDDLWTRTTPEIDTGKTGYYTQHMAHLVEVDKVSAAYLRACADTTHKTPSQIIGEMIRERIAASM